MGIIHGGSAFPESLTLRLPNRGTWEEPFNNTYVNYSRDNLPNVLKISEIVERLIAVVETAVAQEGGRIEQQDGKKICWIKTDLARAEP